ncbi:hypothetical protein CWS02_12505 [Enterobacter sp. EA-1]|nr:hypothetical protein CWS02_12505 [Enterobacter sp. EA-1]
MTPTLWSSFSLASTREHGSVHTIVKKAVSQFLKTVNSNSVKDSRNDRSSKPFTAITHELADIEKINGKVFTMNMVYTYALIEGYQSNGQTAYFSQDRLEASRVTRQTVVKLGGHGRDGPD